MSGLSRRRRRRSRRRARVRSAGRSRWTRVAGLIVARSEAPGISWPGPVHPLAHPSHTVHAAMASAVSRGEYRPQYHQCGQRECPEAEVFSELLESTFRTVGKIKNEVAGDTQRRRRDQRYEVDHPPPPCLRSYISSVADSQTPIPWDSTPLAQNRAKPWQASPRPRRQWFSRADSTDTSSTKPTPQSLPFAHHCGDYARASGSAGSRQHRCRDTQGAHGQAP
jgi:hypothetical protein